MNKFTFTFFTDDNEIVGYLFGITRAEAQEVANELNKETNKKHYYMEGFFE